MTIDWHSKLVDDTSVKFRLPKPSQECLVFLTRGEHFCVTFDKPIPVTLDVKMMVINDERDTCLVLKQVTIIEVIKITAYNKITEDGELRFRLMLVPIDPVANHGGIALEQAFGCLVADFKFVIGDHEIKTNEFAILAQSDRLHQII